MIPFPKYLKLSAIAASGLILCAQGAQVPQHIDIKQLSKTVEDVVVPLPNEIFGALNKLGYQGVADLRQGKYFEITLDGGLNKQQAQAEVERMAREVLTNPVIEEYRCSIED